MADYIDSGATISHDGRYRYLLWREWRGSNRPENWHWYGAKDGNGAELGYPKACLFVMLNPSTADGTQDDPTIRRCVGFAKSWGFDRLEVVNLFAYRATKPADLLALREPDDPVGSQNQEYVEDRAAEAGKIICAWGSHGAHLGQDETVLGWCGPKSTWALGLTRDGYPRHPLYVAANAPLVRFKGRLPEGKSERPHG